MPPRAGAWRSSIRTRRTLQKLKRMGAIDAATAATASGSHADTTPTAPPQALSLVDDAFGRLLLRWQDQQDDEALYNLFTTAQRLLESVAERTLRGAVPDSSSLVDETVSLVLDHLRRLPLHHQTVTDPLATDRAVRPFRPDPRKQNAGRRYLVWLTRRRAMDVARREQRHRRRCRCDTASDPHQVAAAITRESWARQLAAASQARQDDRIEWVRAMLALLDPADRLLMEMAVEGKTLATIAHVLDCSEGTVSRRRQRIERSLREAYTHTHTP